MSIRPVIAAAVLLWATQFDAGAQPVPARAATPSASAPMPAASAGKRGKPARRYYTRHAAPDGATGGDPTTSARTPGGPPPGVPNGITIPIK